MTMSTAGS